MFSLQRQYVFVLWLLAVVALGGVLVARADTGPLFEEVATQPNAPLDMAVSRQRLVRAHPQVLASLLAGDTFVLDLWPDVRYEWQIMHVEAEPFGKRVWSGRLDGFPYGQALFVFDGTFLTAHINTGQRVFQVRPWQNGLYLIEEIDQRRYPQELPPLLPGEQSLGEAFSLGNGVSPGGPFAPLADDGSQIDVMVLYTPAARAAVGGVSQVEALINLAVAETNQAYQNSGVAPRLNLVHMQEVAYAESGSFSTDLSRLQGTSDGYMDAIHGWRDTYHADLVSLIIEDTQYCGLGYFMSSASSAFASWGFTVVARTCATGYYSFGHELGHNMGLQHDWYVDDATYQYTYSHGYLNVGGGWRTIMSYNSECSDSGTYCTRLQYFSNPNTTYNGAAMGVSVGTNTNCVAGDLGHPACDAEAYHVLNNNAYTVANFRVAGGTSTPTNTPIPSPTASPPPTMTPSPTTPPSTPVPTMFSVYLPLVRKDAPPTPTLTPSPTLTPVPTPSQFALQVIDLANQERQNAGCAPLTVDNRLMAAAQAHSEDMALNDFFSHTSLDGTEFWERILAQGYNFSIAGENIAAGYPTPQDVMDGWMNSQGHRDNILNCGYQDIGVGYYYLANDTGSVNYYHYWTMNLAAP